ncbi:outer membrane beta-barrel protein [Carboxylicivirga caseinilyticus]|uniref:outer membrane beta-barrel protein n=1 Tax=Carboxylicivirga caseinilyticus TaxID=3417572 RepID=UPI003D34B4E6|nr:outer membrane beta-barrel protein [Marinilabiliaceae bacterium A049]
MKRNLLILFTLLFSTGLFAQSIDGSKLRVGAGLVYATDINNVGVAINGVYSFTNQWEGAAGFTHVFKKNYVSYNIVDFDAHYVFHELSEKFNIYGLAGLGLTFWKIEGIDIMGYTIPDQTGSEVGVNLGVGGNYAITENLNLAPEVRFTVMDGSFARLGATLQYRF